MTNRVNHGEAFYGTSYNTGVGNGQNKDYLVKVPAGVSVKMELAEFKADGSPVIVTLYEGAVVAEDGTPIREVNSNRNFADNAAVELFSAPSLASFGQPLTSWVHLEAGDEMKSNEFVLKADTNYMVRMTNVSGATVNVFANFAWREYK